MSTLNYATEYASALAQAYPYVLNFGALYNTENNGRYRFSGGATIQIPNVTTTGRVDGDRDTIETAMRNYQNAWESKALSRHRKWSTLVHPMDIDETNFATSIENITSVYNQEQKFPEMDAYLVSKLYADWTGAGKTASTTVLTDENILEEFDEMMEAMTEARVPLSGRVLYVTPAVETVLKNAAGITRAVDLSDGGTAYNRAVSQLDKVEIVAVPTDLMKTAYDFETGWEVAAGAKQVNMMLVHPSAVITPVKYEFAKLDEPSAGSEGKYIYFEESFEDVFLLAKKADGVAFNVSE